MDYKNQTGIKLLEHDNSLIYLFENKADFSMTEYKVLNSIGNFSLVRSMRILIDGKLGIQYYNDCILSPLSSIVTQLNSDELSLVIKSMFLGIDIVVNNGFLNICNLDYSFDHVFVDRKTLNVRMIYIPINVREQDEQRSNEKKWICNIIELIKKSSLKISDEILLCIENDNIDSLSIRKVYLDLRANNLLDDLQPIIVKNIHQPNLKLKLKSINFRDDLVFIIEKDNYCLGKQQSNDGVIECNTVSRKHCVISYLNNCYTIKDLSSTNGTYVNGDRVYPDKPLRLCDKDVVRIADVDFKVELY